MNEKGYISMFKINGTPILPPLMNVARRREMLAYKELAMALETRLKLEEKHANVDEHDLESVSTIEDEYLKVSNLLQDHFGPSKLKARRISELKNPSDFLKKSDTFIYDIQANTVLIPGDKEEAIGDGGNIRNVRCTGISKFSNICQVGTNLGAQKSTTRKPPAVNKSLTMTPHEAPQISINPPTPEATSKNVGESSASSTPNSQKNTARSDSENRKKTPKRASTSPSLKDCPPSVPVRPLVRSNSFTLDSPSPVLLEHLIRNRTKNLEAFGNFIINSTHEPIKQPKPGREGIVINVTPSKRPSPFAKTANEQPNPSTTLITNSTMFKNKKSPYDVKMNGKSKVLKKHKLPLKKMSSIILKPRLSVSHHRSKVILATTGLKAEQQKKSAPSAQQFDTIQQKLKQIEEGHRLRLLELIKRQQDEQSQMQVTFERQQKQLLDEFNAGLMSLQIPSVLKLDSDAEILKHSNNNNNDNEISSKKSSMSSMHGSEYFDVTDTEAIPTIGKESPRCNRRLFNENKNIASPSTPKRTKPSGSRIPSPPRRRIEMAATTINAYAKGYLVRRLFHTDYVQKIVQTIRDTLLFVLDFHRETENDTTIENLSLKTRLLQQLTSACHTLHAVFFTISTKERMEIIAKDRNYIQIKTKGLNRYKS